MTGVTGMMGAKALTVVTAVKAVTGLKVNVICEAVEVILRVQ